MNTSKARRDSGAATVRHGRARRFLWLAVVALGAACSLGAAVRRQPVWVDPKTVIPSWLPKEAGMSVDELYAGLGSRAGLPRQVKEAKTGFGVKGKKPVDSHRFSMLMTDLKQASYRSKNVKLKMEYLYFEPELPAEGAKVPLVVFLHGRSEPASLNKGELQRNRGPLVFIQPDTQRKYPCYFLSPINPTPWSWGDLRFDNVTDQLRVAMEIVDVFLEKHPDIDRDRLYITGFSDGASGTWETIGKYPGRFAAAIPISGDWFPEMMKQKGGIAVWAFYNRRETPNREKDTDRMLQKVVDLGGLAQKTVYNGTAHDAWSRAYAEPDMVPWLFSQKRFKPK